MQRKRDGMKNKHWKMLFQNMEPHKIKFSVYIKACKRTSSSRLDSNLESKG